MVLPFVSLSIRNWLRRSFRVRTSLLEELRHPRRATKLRRASGRYPMSL